MKKILLVAINARYTHSCLALYCLKSFARDLGHDIVIREFSINRRIDAIIADIVAEQSDAVAFSVYIWNVELIKQMLPAVQELRKKCMILLGGPEVSYNPESWLEAFPGVDCIIIGGGEAGFRRLLEENLSLREKIIRIPNPRFETMPMPYASEDLEALKNKYIYYESSRGCPFHCSYCLSSRGDQELEMKRTDTVKDELRFILSHGPQLIKFVDRTFNIRHEHYRAIWAFLLENCSGGHTKFHFEIHPSHLDEDDFAILARCPEDMFQFEIGVQSTNPETLAAVGRTGRWNEEKEAIRRLISLGTIRVHCDMIAGLPYDDMASLARTFDELYGLRPDHLQVGFLKLLPGTEMRERSEEYGNSHSQYSPYQVLENRWLSRADMRLVEKIAFLIDRLYNTRRFDLTLNALAGRYESPFNLYRDLARIRDAAGAPLTRRWETGADFLMRAAITRFPGKKSFFLDALRWDWCAGTRSHRYPDLIKPENAAGIKKSGYSFFRDMAEDSAVRYRDATFELSDLKRALFFKAESDEFRHIQMDSYSCALFLPEKKVIFYNA